MDMFLGNYPDRLDLLGSLDLRLFIVRHLFTFSMEPILLIVMLSPQTSILRICKTLDLREMSRRTQTNLGLLGRFEQGDT